MRTGEIVVEEDGLPQAMLTDSDEVNTLLVDTWSEKNLSEHLRSFGDQSYGGQ